MPILADEVAMQEAMLLARKAQDCAEVPVGAVITHNGIIVGRGHNKPITTNNPTAHAEVVAIESAAAEMGNYRLNNATLYCTLEPCLMCYGAMIHARIMRCVYAAKDPKSGVVSLGLVEKFHCKFNHNIHFVPGPFSLESKQLLQNFFKKKR